MKTIFILRLLALSTMLVGLTTASRAQPVSEKTSSSTTVSTKTHSRQANFCGVGISSWRLRFRLYMGFGLLTLEIVSKNLTTHSHIQKTENSDCFFFTILILYCNHGLCTAFQLHA